MMRIKKDIVSGYYLEFADRPVSVSRSLTSPSTMFTVDILSSGKVAGIEIGHPQSYLESAYVNHDVTSKFEGEWLIVKFIENTGEFTEEVLSDYPEMQDKIAFLLDNNKLVGIRIMCEILDKPTTEIQYE